MTAARELPQAVSGMTMEIVKVTPAIAEKWLGKNTKNRHLAARSVTKYKRAMLKGEWLLNGEAIKFAVDGSLLDGQHRLAAIIQADKTISMLVVRGLPAAAQNVIDNGRARTVGDQLGIAGFVDPRALAAAARAAILYEAGRMQERTEVPSRPEVLEFVAGNEMLGFATARGRLISKGSGIRPAIAAMCFYELMKVDDPAAQEFFDRLTDGVNLPEGSPILALRNRVRAVRDDRTWLPLEAMTSLVFRTWNAWREGRTMASLPIYRNGETIPCPEPK